MAVISQGNLAGQQRIDVPHLRSIESGVAGDFDILSGRIFGGERALIIKGFNVLTSASTVGSLATALQISVADAIMVNVNSTESGSIFWSPTDIPNETLDPSGGKVIGAFTAGATNYVGIDLVREADATTTDLVKFLDANTEEEISQEVPLRRTLQYRFTISTTPFSATANTSPIAIVTTDSSNRVTGIQDARNLAFRLGQGGEIPNTGFAYAWPNGRSENTSVTTAFIGGDKGIGSLKESLEAIMTRLWELGGGANWYSPTADRNVRMVRKPPPSVFSSGDNFEGVSNNLHWKGLSIVFDNANSAGVYYNEIADQLTSSTGLTNLAVGECLYVDIDRTQNRSGVNAITAHKAALQSMGTPDVPGSRYVIAWRTSNSGTFDIFTRDFPYYVGTLFTPATSISTGVVKLSRDDTVSPTTPVVISIEGGRITPSASVLTPNPALTIDANVYNGGIALKLNGGGGGAALGEDAALWAAGGSAFGTIYSTTAGTGSVGIYAASTAVSMAIRAVSNSGTVVGSVNGTPIQGISGVNAAPGVFGLSYAYGVQGLGRDAVAASGNPGGGGARFDAGIGDGTGNGGIGAIVNGGGSGSGATGTGGLALQVIGGPAFSTNGSGGNAITATGGISTNNLGGTAIAATGGVSASVGGRAATFFGGNATGTNTNGSNAMTAQAGSALGTGTGGTAGTFTGGAGGLTNGNGGLALSITAGAAGGTGTGGTALTAVGGASGGSSIGGSAGSFTGGLGGAGNGFGGLSLISQGGAGQGTGNGGLAGDFIGGSSGAGATGNGGSGFSSTGGNAVSTNGSGGLGSFGRGGNGTGIGYGGVGGFFIGGANSANRGAGVVGITSNIVPPSSSTTAGTGGYFSGSLGGVIIDQSVAGGTGNGLTSISGTSAANFAGIFTHGGGSSNSVIQSNGWIDMSGAATPATVADKILTPQGVMRAAARITTRTSAGGPVSAVNSNFNFSDVTGTGTGTGADRIYLTLSSLTIGTEFCIQITDFNGGTAPDMKKSVIVDSLDTGGAGGRTRIILTCIDRSTGANAAFGATAAGFYVGVWSFN